MTAIELNSVSFSYGKRQALTNLSFSVRQGSMTALLGPNGGGKTTAFRILSTLIRPDSGTVRIEGFDAVNQPFEVRRKSGIVFQNNSLDHELNSFENLTHQGHLHGLKGSDLRRRIDQLLERFNLSDRARDPIKAFSGGLQRRVELAKALLHKPSVLLLDEPTTGLDPKVRREFWKYLAELQQQERMTVLLTTHSLGEAEKCSHLILIDEGRLITQGTPDALKKEIGEEVVVIHAADAISLAESIRSDFEFEVEAIDGLIRIERSDGHLLIAHLVEKYSSRIDSVTVSKPTLEDVFIQKTGHRFESTADQI